MPGRVTHRTLSERLSREPDRIETNGFAITLIPLICVGRTREEALSGLDLTSLLKYANDHRWISAPEGGRFESAADLSGLLLYGTPDDIVEQLLEYPRFGVTDVILDLRLRPSELDTTIDTIATKVVPRFREAVSA
jgi:alkanesulfonate monooxygenase SsuD/methylene tetrahydromethanopterin reductase-like flavin-dependent oxidoreductase (luciferase family)